MFEPNYQSIRDKETLELEWELQKAELQIKFLQARIKEIKEQLKYRVPTFGVPIHAT